MTIYKNDRPIIEVDEDSYFADAIGTIAEAEANVVNCLIPEEDIPEAIIYLSGSSRKHLMYQENLYRWSLQNEPMTFEQKNIYYMRLADITRELEKIDEAIAQLKFLKSMAEVRDINEEGKEIKTRWTFKI